MKRKLTVYASLLLLCLLIGLYAPWPAPAALDFGPRQPSPPPSADNGVVRLAETALDYLPGRRFRGIAPGACELEWCLSSCDEVKRLIESPEVDAPLGNVALEAALRLPHFKDDGLYRGYVQGDLVSAQISALVLSRTHPHEALLTSKLHLEKLKEYFESARTIGTQAAALRLATQSLAVVCAIRRVHKISPDWEAKLHQFWDAIDRPTNRAISEHYLSARARLLDPLTPGFPFIALSNLRRRTRSTFQTFDRCVLDVLRVTPQMPECMNQRGFGWFLYNATGKLILESQVGGIWDERREFAEAVAGVPMLGLVR